MKLCVNSYWAHIVESSLLIQRCVSAGSRLVYENCSLGSVFEAVRQGLCRYTTVVLENVFFSYFGSVSLYFIFICHIADKNIFSVLHCSVAALKTHLL